MKGRKKGNSRPRPDEVSKSRLNMHHLTQRLYRTQGVSFDTVAPSLKTKAAEHRVFRHSADSEENANSKSSLVGYMSLRRDDHQRKRRGEEPSTYSTRLRTSHKKKRRGDDSINNNSTNNNGAMSADQDEKRASSSFPAPPLSLNRPVLGKGLVVSKQKRSRLVQRPHENTESSEVQVPPTLRPLLGDHLSLRRTGMGMASSLITQQTSAQAQVLPSPSARGARARSRSSRSSSSPANALRNALSFSQRGQLPTSSISLQAMKSKLRRTPDTADPTQTSIPSNPSISARRERERKRERDSNISNYNNTNASSISKQDAQQQLMEKKLQEAVAKSQREEYEKYLMSPFSFIDKVIESPYTEEFVYLNSNGAYDLQIVKHDQIDPDNYYTMSRAGVTHFYHTETDFTSLDQWEREYFLYTKMMEIPFFKKYRGWKGFYFWKKLIRATKSNKYRKFLGENLYVLNNYLCTSLIKLRELCYKASRWTLFKVDPKKTLTLDQFRFEQAKQIDQVMEDLKKLNKDVRTIVSRACDIDLCEFLINNGFRKSKGDDSSGSGGKEVDMAGGNDDDYPQKISHAEKAAIRTKCRKLTKYIRLADYFIIDTLVTLCLDRTGDVLGLVERKQEKERKEKERKEKELMEKKGGKFDKKTTRASKAHQKEELLPLFSVELALDNKTFKLQFDPPVQEFQAQLEHSIDHAVKKVMAPKRLIKSDDFNSYTQVNVEDGDEDQALEFKLDSMVFQEESFIEVKQGIKQGLANAFVKAAKYATKFEPYRDIFVDNEQTDIASYRDASILEFSQLINKYTAQIKLFDDIATSSNIGVIQVDSSALKARLVPSPKQRLKEVERLLPRVAREKADQLLDELSKANLKISVVPNDVDHFVEIMAFLAEIQEKQQQNQERYLFIAELYNLMHEYKIRVADEDKLIFEKLTTTRTMFKNSIFFSEASINSNTEKFNKELTLDIPILSKNIDDVIVLMTDDCISAIPTDPQDVENVLKFLEEAEMTLEDLEAKATKFRNYQDVLQTPDPVDFDNIRTARADLDIKMELWSSIKTWGKYTTQWMTEPFNEIDVAEISRQVQLYNKTYAKCKRSPGMENNPVVPMLRANISAFQDTLPVVSDLRNEHLQQHHWDDINDLLQTETPLQEDEHFSLGTLIELNAMNHKQEIAVISNKARQEAALQELLRGVENTWKNLDFPVQPHRDQKDVYILGNLDDIIQVLDESLVTINQIMGSHFVDPIRDIVQEWNNKLLLFQDTIEEWMVVQRSWIYLETIFSSPDIARQLQDEAAMFSQVDSAWKEIMRRTNDQRNAITAGTYVGLKDNFQNYNAVLERVQKKLEAFLETRRVLFPRFYFLSSDELIKIISQSKSLTAVEKHLPKIFDAIHSLEFGENREIRAMISPQGERVDLKLKVRGSVEIWLQALESDMIKSLKRYMRKGVTDYEKMPRRDWVLAKFAQIVMTVSQIAWCRGNEIAIESDNPKLALSRWLEVQSQFLQDLTSLVRRPELTKLERKKIVALITTDVHGRDVTAKLRDEEVSHLNNFTWQQQLRFYWEPDIDDCVVRQSNAEFNYGYEYMGVSSRLVITPLTDRCWMTITSALHIKFGAAPAGPAGTGKTESTKDLAKALGYMCVVYNCSEQIKHHTMARFFSGLAQTGAWTCLDEFNRIDIEVLSVIAQQLMEVREALKVWPNPSKFVFQGKEIKLKPTFGVMITMNPGYAGRTELPDNLKVLFRPVSMMIPDYAQIAMIMLFAEGFDTAPSLSKKMVKLYKLASEQLSQQDHYDFGLRALKSVLVMAGSLKRAQPDLNESSVLIRAMRDSNIPKFTSADIPLFEAIVQDLFPGVDVIASSENDLHVMVDEVIEELGLQLVPAFRQKVLQLFDTFDVRFGVMVVGPTGAGKSTCYNVLAQAMTRLRKLDNPDSRYQTVFTHVLNPKSLTMQELYGDVDTMTQDFTDGLGSHIMREAMKDETDNKHWVVFDGPVDAMWIENMNTVLDDNMTLCLVNGERLKLKPSLRMLFEVQDLAVASPATVSRCGMVYMTPQDLGYLPYVRSWLPSLPDKCTDELKDYLYNLFVTKMPSGLAFIREKCKEPIPTVDIQIATNLCILFEAVFSEENGVKITADLDEMSTFVEIVFAFCYAWALGGSLTQESQKAFDKFLADLFINVRPTGSMFDSFVDVESMNWQSWESGLSAFEYDAKLPYFELQVPTIDTVRYSSLMATLLEIERSVFLTGVTGVGKSVIAAGMFQQYKESRNFASMTMNFSAQTDARQTQETIESKLVRVRKHQLGAPQGKRLIIFIDDVNMPMVEKYGAQPPIELLRQFQDYKGFYDRVKPFWKSVVDTTIACAAAPPGGGRAEMTQRFTRHFNIFNVPAPTESTMKRIFGSILGGFLQQFKLPLQKLRDMIISSTIELYETIEKELLPTPAKSHYTFNLRDISKVVQGILMIKPVNCSTSNTMIRLWIHECQRCFYDRLVNDEDRRWFTQKITSLLAKHFGLPWTHEELFERTWILFGDFMRPGVERNYEENQNKDISLLLDDYLEEYNLDLDNTQMKLVFFEDAVKHISRISRILRQPRGNAMLVGVGGSGKQSLTKLACAMREMPLLEMEMLKGFDYSMFQEQLMGILKEAGVKGNDVAFLFTENQIVEERFLEDINNILNAGEVPNLFPQDELMKIMEELTPVVKKMGLQANRTVVYNTFVERVRNHLHIVLCMSPVGSAFRERCRRFPSLINCTTIDWFAPWPTEALVSVSDSFLREVDLPSDKLRDALVQMCVYVHQSMEETCEKFYFEQRRRVYTTPKSYLDLINLYLNLLDRKRDEMNGNCNRLINGLDKLKDTEIKVGELRVVLEKLQPSLIQKSAETTALLAQAKIDQERADKVKEVVEAEEKLVAKQTAEVREVQADAQADLELAMPQLRGAIKALSKLKAAEISEVKTMGNPPIGVMRTMEAVCILLGHTNPDWDTSKKVLSRMDFMKSLKEFQQESITPKMINRLQKYVTDPKLAEERMISVSRPAMSMMSWVRAMVNYNKVAKDVGPKQKRVEEMNALLAQANAKLKEKQGQLQQVVASVNALNRKCEQTLLDKNRLEQKSKQTKDRLIRAEKLTSALGGERVRWKHDSEEITRNLDFLVGDVFLSSAAISYIGAFTGQYRKQLMSTWVEECKSMDIPVSDNFSLRNTLGSDVEVRSWNINGLPTDEVSIDSGIIVQYADRWPLMIDPQLQAYKWIKNEHKNDIVICRFSDANMLMVLENALRLGKPLLIEDIGEQVDASIDSILLKQTFEDASGYTKVKIGKNRGIDFDPHFRLYMTTKLPNPHYLPEVCIKVTLLNFTVTRKGLEDQLLGQVVKKERFDVERRKEKLVLSMAADRKQLDALEEKILKMLSESKDNMLDDEDLIETLNDSKETSSVIQGRVKETAETQKDINQIREKYRPVAIRGSIVYFVVSDLSLIDPMYQNSLDSFMRLFINAIDQSEPSADLDKRLTNLMDYLTEAIYKNICRGLFETHKSLFSFLITSQILRQRGDILQAEWSFLLANRSMAIEGPAAKLSVEEELEASSSGDAAAAAAAQKAAEQTIAVSNPDPSVISKESWAFLKKMETEMECFKGLSIDISVKYDDLWKPFVTANSPHTLPIPSSASGTNWEEKLTPFQKLLVLKTFRQEKLMFAFSNFVSQNLGKQYVESITIQMIEVYNDTDFRTPVVFVLSQGADPTQQLLRFAEERKMKEKLSIISLGQGQGKRAREAIEQSKKTGSWVLLQNCHLAKSWMGDLAIVVDALNDDGVKCHKDFRLWLTSMPADYFPVSVLQRSVKLTNEPPKGLRANLLRSYKNVIDGKSFETCSKPRSWKKLLYGLCFFHAVIQERKKFGSLGWNKTYEFNDSDLETSVMFLRLFLDEQDRIPWDALRYVCGQINYGGRVTDDFDRRCLMSILRKFYTPSILEQDYKFSISGDYFAPKEGKLQHYVDFISNLPSEADPEIFGMHENANISYQEEETQQILKTILALQPRESVGGSGKSSDQIVAEMTAEIEAKLPPLLDRKRAGPGTFAMTEEGDIDSLGIFLQQEMALFNKLLVTLKKTLANIQRAITGEVVMSQELDHMYDSVLKNMVPELWNKVSYASLKPLSSWQIDLHQRYTMLDQWLTTGKPHSYWLSGFFFPQGFLTGVLQNHARRYKIPIDSLNFSFHVLPIHTPDPLLLMQHSNASAASSASADGGGGDGHRDGVYIHGLFMDGGRWDVDKKMVVDAKLGELFSPMPIIHFLPSKSYTPSPTDYKCPVYKTSVRAGILSTTGQSTNFVLPVYLNSNLPPDYWVLQGTALLCQLDS